MFSGAHRPSITGGTFTTIQGDFHAHVYVENGFQALQNKVAPGAFHNSAERYDPPKCHEGTRQAILKEIADWVQDLGKEAFFLWLYGPAGAGKSAIAQTIAELCYEAGLLAASFFFSRTAAGRHDATHLIPTLAYQLATAIPETREYVTLAVETDPLIFTRSLEAQLEALVVQPFSNLLQSGHFENVAEVGPRFIIIDGLDECGEPKIQVSILTTLSSALRRSHVPLFFLIASRPEPDIRDAFNEEAISSMTRRLALDDTYQPDADIKTFLTSKFAHIKQHHRLGSYLPVSWPSPFDIDGLVQKSSGQFIYAATVMKFVESSRHRPTERLNMIFGLATPGKNAPFAELDSLYTHIFESVDDVEAVIEVLSYVLLMTDQAVEQSTDLVERFFEYQQGDLQVILADLHSVILVPLPQDRSKGLRLLHASLGDFLMDKSRSGRFFIEPPQARARLALRCLKHISAGVNLSELAAFEGEEKHRLIAYRSFLDQCSKAYPAEELFQALWNFDLLGFLSLLGHIQPRYQDNPIHAFPAFLGWVERQTHLNDLRDRYLAEFDGHLLAQISHYPSNAHTDCLIAGLTLDSYFKGHNGYRLMEIITQHIPTFQRSPLITDKTWLYLIGLSALDADYSSMLTAFFTDKSRSRHYFVTPARYVELANRILKYLSRPYVDGYFADGREPTERYASATLQEILIRLPKNRLLVLYLRAQPIREDAYGREQMVEAIEAYIKPIIKFFDIERTLPPMNYEDNLNIPNYDESDEEEDADNDPTTRRRHQFSLPSGSPAAGRKKSRA
ncbi:hypothetical protein GALMADRAFT_135644 [Galerina marginata CBS 339.88]|uniref:Nephrocystin 3-like N-terminal domain-containing protein n=1 Tax=Galerina marginata (strain CBS 339.88) TaxID=685588 RepID=A0A067TGJ9_GALM3|nr:hypothetical protein GALMADRAFT_135644 [Galerina marginata CBS 339.88]